MWRSFHNVLRGRIFSNGNWRSSNQICCSDDVQETQNFAPVLTQCFRSGQFCQSEQSKKEEEKQYRARQYAFNNLNSSCLTSAFFVSSSLVLTCKLSQLLKHSYHQRQRCNDFLRDEALRKIASYEFQAAFSVGKRSKRSQSARGSLRNVEQEDKETLCDLEEEAVSIAQSPRRHSTFYESGHFKFPKSYPEAVFVLHERSSDSEKECENLATAASAEPRVSFESGSATPTPDESPDVYDAFFSDLKQTYARLVDEYDAKRKEIDSGKSSASDSNKNCFVSSKTITDARKAKFIDAVAHELANRTDEAMSLYREAMLLGNGEAAYNLALIHLRRGEPGDEDEYVRLLQTASELGTTRATTELAVFLAERNLMPKALALFQQAAKEQDPDALFSLGVCFEQGLGVQKNRRKAKEFYAAALEAGHEEAENALDRCTKTKKSATKVEYNSKSDDLEPVPWPTWDFGKQILADIDSTQYETPKLRSADHFQSINSRSMALAAGI